jgi:hypothetical protein
MAAGAECRRFAAFLNALHLNPIFGEIEPETAVPEAGLVGVPQGPRQSRFKGL